MAQPARESRKTPLSIEPFWERPTSDPPIRWEKWRIQLKLAILARENITIDTLLQPKPSTVRLPEEPRYEMPIDDTTEEAERERRIRNNQLKLQWELKCQKITEAGILCRERPRNGGAPPIQPKICSSNSQYSNNKTKPQFAPPIHS